MIIVCTGWSTSPLPMPTLLDQRAASELGGQLLRQFRTGPWSIGAQEIVDWLDDCGYISIVGDTAVSDPALATVRGQQAHNAETTSLMVHHEAGFRSAKLR